MVFLVDPPDPPGGRTFRFTATIKAGDREWTVPVIAPKSPEDWHNRNFLKLVTQIVEHFPRPSQYVLIETHPAPNDEHFVTLTVGDARASFGPLPIAPRIAKIYRAVELQHWFPNPGTDKPR